MPKAPSNNRANSVLFFHLHKFVKMKKYLLLYSADFGLMVILPRVSRSAVGTSCV